MKISKDNLPIVNSKIVSHKVIAMEIPRRENILKFFVCKSCEINRVATRHFSVKYKILYLFLISLKQMQDNNSLYSFGMFVIEVAHPASIDFFK